ncbi:MAG: hypothetical protein L6R42_009795 [Xanthoria sp. 1 TBL-2021]|nr:MAG: hypothetical protein L6R42_009795 [Xanthoria sp. 1 TBL-2021]
MPAKILDWIHQIARWFYTCTFMALATLTIFSSSNYLSPHTLVLLQYLGAPNTHSASSNNGFQTPTTSEQQFIAIILVAVLQIFVWTTLALLAPLMFPILDPPARNLFDQAMKIGPDDLTVEFYSRRVSEAASVAVKQETDSTL